MVQDVKKAYFCAPATRKVYVKLPDEDRGPGEERTCRLLQKTLHGTRDAAHNWAVACTAVLDNIQGQMYQNEGKIKLEEQLNFIQESEVAETLEQQAWRQTSVGSWVQEFKRARRMPIPQGMVLKRRITRNLDGGRIEDMHVNKYFAKLDRWATRSFRWPMATEDEVFVDAVDEPEVAEPGDELLEARATTVFRGLVARVNFLAQDRGDQRFCVKGM